jgi:hypothetical protein
MRPETTGAANARPGVVIRPEIEFFFDTSKYSYKNALIAITNIGGDSMKRELQRLSRDRKLPVVHNGQSYYPPLFPYRRNNAFQEPDMPLVNISGLGSARSLQSGNSSSHYQAMTAFEIGKAPECKLQFTKKSPLVDALPGLATWAVCDPLRRGDLTVTDLLNTKVVYENTFGDGSFDSYLSKMTYEKTTDTGSTVHIDMDAFNEQFTFGPKLFSTNPNTIGYYLYEQSASSLQEKDGRLLLVASFLFGIKFNYKLRNTNDKYKFTRIGMELLRDRADVGSGVRIVRGVGLNMAPPGPGATTAMATAPAATTAVASAATATTAAAIPGVAVAAGAGAAAAATTGMASKPHFSHIAKNTDFLGKEIAGNVKHFVDIAAGQMAAEEDGAEGGDERLAIWPALLVDGKNISRWSILEKAAKAFDSRECDGHKATVKSSGGASGGGAGAGVVAQQAQQIAEMKVAQRAKEAELGVLQAMGISLNAQIANLQAEVGRSAAGGAAGGAGAAVAAVDSLLASKQGEGVAFSDMELMMSVDEELTEARDKKYIEVAKDYIGTHQPATSFNSGSALSSTSRFPIEKDEEGFAAAVCKEVILRVTGKATNKRKFDKLFAEACGALDLPVTATDS